MRLNLMTLPGIHVEVRLITATGIGPKNNYLEMQQVLKDRVFSYITTKMQHFLEITAPILHDELVEKCKLGDSRSYAEIYQKYAKAMYNTSLRIVNNTGDAEDVLQESFVDAFASLETFQYKSTFGAWMKKIVINKSINHLRKKKLDLIDIDKTVVANLPQEETLDEKELQMKVSEIKAAVKLLPNGYRTVLSLYLFEGYDHEEIAEILRISHATVRTQYMRAKQKLISLIKEGGLS